MPRHGARCANAYEFDVNHTLNARFFLNFVHFAAHSLLQTMARREGRRGRRDDHVSSSSSGSSSESDNEGNGGNSQANQPNQQLARWTEERIFLLLETIESAPNRLYQEDPTWGRAVPYSRRRDTPPKNCLANIEYGDIGSVLTRARSDLNNNPIYLALSLQLPISEAVLRDKYNEQLKIAKRLRAAAPDKAVFEQDESHPRVLKLAIKINKQILSGKERREGNNYCYLLFIYFAAK